MGIFFSSIFGKRKVKSNKMSEPVKQTKTPSVKMDKKSFEGFRMTVDFDSESSAKYYLQPTADMVDELINEMSKGLVNFIIVEHSESVGGCVFVQCAYGGESVYQVEAQVRVSTPNGVLHKQYRMFSDDVNTVKNMFAKFLDGQAPDVKDENDWEYMDEFDFYEE